MTTVAKTSEQAPDRIAVIYGNREHVETYGELEERSRRMGHVLRSWGLEPGDSVAALIANDDCFFDLFWACHRTGLYLTPLNWHLQRDEVQYIVDNCDAKLFVAHERFAEMASAVKDACPGLTVSASVAGELPAFAALKTPSRQCRPTDRSRISSRAR